MHTARPTPYRIAALSGLPGPRGGMGAGVAVLAATMALAAVVGPQGLGEAQLLPYGEFAARDGRPGPGQTWKVSNESGRALAAQLNTIAAKTPVVIDYEHQTLTAAEKGHLAPASGWIQRAEWRDNQGLFATVQWTAAAAARIDAKEYLFISPVIAYDDAGNVTGVLMAALVNYPALTGMDPALSSALSALTGTLNPPEHTTMNREALCALLGLPATATDAQINDKVAALSGELPTLRAELQQLKARPALPAALATALGVPAAADETAALSAVTALKTAAPAGGDATVQLVAALQAQVLELTTKSQTAELDGLLDKAIAEHRLLPALRAQYAAIGKTNFAQLKALIDAAPVIEGLGGQTGGQERGDQGGTAALSGEAQKVMALCGLTPEQFAKGAKAAA